MLATIIHAPRDIRVETVPDPVLSTGGDAIVKVVAACVCGSDLWPYRGVTPTHDAHRIGHEFVGVVEAIGDDVKVIEVGDFVIAPFYVCDNTCINCRNGVSTSCLHGGWWGGDDRFGGFADGGQGERVRVPLADGTLVAVRDEIRDDQVPGLLTLSDVMGTGHHAASPRASGRATRWRRRRRGRRALRHHRGEAASGPRRSSRCRGIPSARPSPATSGATHIVAERGDVGVTAVQELTRGIGADRVLECVGTKESMDQAIRSARPGGMVGYVGAPNGGPELPVRPLFNRNVGVNGGVAPVRGYIEELLPDVLSGRDRARPGLRPRAAALRGRRGVRRHGRASRGQGAAAAMSELLERTRRRGRRAAVRAVHARRRVGARRPAARGGLGGGASGRDRDLARPAAGVPHRAARFLGRQRRLARPQASRRRALRPGLALSRRGVPRERRGLRHALEARPPRVRGARRRRADPHPRLSASVGAVGVSGLPQQDDHDLVVAQLRAFLAEQRQGD
jgi:threonine dehydrogenase-like Zn-dependent dehydrogenase